MSGDWSTHDFVDDIMWRMKMYYMPRFIRLTLAANGLPCYIQPSSVVCVTQESGCTEVIVDRGVRFQQHVKEDADEIVKMIDPPKEQR